MKHRISSIAAPLSVDDNFFKCTNTYRRYSDLINPYPSNPESVEAIHQLFYNLIHPIIEKFGRENFKLTYGFCSKDLKRFLEKKNPLTGIKNGRICPEIDQHMAHELNSKGKYYCKRLGAACDFLIAGISSDEVARWVINKLPFDSLYFYGNERPIHLSFGSQHKRDIWGFNQSGQPRKISF